MWLTSTTGINYLYIFQCIDFLSKRKLCHGVNSTTKGHERELSTLILNSYSIMKSKAQAEGLDLGAGIFEKREGRGCGCRGCRTIALAMGRGNDFFSWLLLYSQG